MRSSRSDLVLGIALSFAFFASGCARLEKAGGPGAIAARVIEDFRALALVITGSPSPKAKPSAADQARTASAELLNELFRVVLLRDPVNESEFGVFLSALGQGGTLEGVYNGFTHSAIYRNKEMRYGSASPEALQAFARLISELQPGLVYPTLFEPSAAKPLTEIDPMRESEPSPSGSPAPHAAMASSPADVARLFEGASLFTLKRVLGDEALKVVSQQQVRGTLAKWYGAFAAQQASKGVDFGLELRNKADEAFHVSWAERVLKSSQQDRLIWEVLNRVHRTLNHAELKARSAEKAAEHAPEKPALKARDPK